MPKPITDPALLAQLEGAPPKGAVTDAALLALLDDDHPAGPSPSQGEGVPAALDAPDPAQMPYGEQMSRVGGAIDSGVRAVANGIPFMDRIAAAGGAATGIGGTFGDYSGNLERQRGEDKKLEEAAPIANTAGHFIGGALVPMGALGAAGRAASLGGKSLVGAISGLGFGGAQGVSDSKDLTDVPDVAKNAATSGTIGLITGGALPGLGRVIGAGVQKGADLVRGKVDGISRNASGHLVDALRADGADTVRGQMGRLGDDAMLVDAGPAFLGKGQGASLNSDEGRSVLQTALTERNAATNARIQGDVERALGPAEDPQTVTNAIRAHRSEVDSKAYPKTLDAAPEVKTGDIMLDIEGLLSHTPPGGMEHKALSNLQKMMTKTEKKPLTDVEGLSQFDKLGNERFHDVASNQTDASMLHKIKQELDNVIEYDAPGLGVPAAALQRQQGALKQLRYQINDALENQVPGYREANRASAALAKRGTAVEEGTQYLGSGKTTPSPDRFATEFAAREPGEQIAFAKGSRGNIDRVLGTKANDLQALRTELQGEGGWNTAKLATVHGQDAADELVNSVDRNLKFRDTHNKVVENSQTAQRLTAARAMKPEPSSETPMINPSTTMTGFLGTGAKKALGMAWEGLTRKDPTRSYGEVARELTKQGSERDQLLEALMQAMERRQANENFAQPIGNRAALAAAMLGNGAVRERQMRTRQQQ